MTKRDMYQAIPNEELGETRKPTSNPMEVKGASRNCDLIEQSTRYLQEDEGNPTHVREE